MAFKRFYQKKLPKFVQEGSSFTAQKIKFSIKAFFSKCVQIRRKLRIWLHLLKKSLMETSFFVQCFKKTPKFHMYTA